MSGEKENGIKKIFSFSRVLSIKITKKSPDLRWKKEILYSLRGKKSPPWHLGRGEPAAAVSGTAEPFLHRFRNRSGLLIVVGG